VPLFVRILSGARAGQIEALNEAVISAGRHPSSILKFDIKSDIDVSSKHAEIRHEGDHWTIQDLRSTNGTFVNGNRIEQWPVVLRDGDRVMFGKNGPTVEVHTKRQFTPSMPMPTVKRSNTEERVALAVRKQTAGIRTLLIGLMVLLAIGVGTAFYMGRRSSSKQLEQLKLALAQNDSLGVVLQSQIRGGGAADTALANDIQRQIDSLRTRLAHASPDSAAGIRAGIGRLETRLRGMIHMDLPAINTRNAPAVAIVVSLIGGKAFAGTAFSIDSNGVLLTNRHNVRDENGQEATKIAVKFVNTGEWRPAHTVKVSDAQDADLAIVQMNDAGPYPVISGISARGDDATEGLSVAIIGFPFGYSTPQEGVGNDFIAKSSLNGGTVSKLTSSVLQIDSFAGHGSSGSPVFDARGDVVGVVWGGQAEAGGRIVYAVPPELLAAFIPAEYRAIVRQ
jgi:pSer/pThr/pTyr-binding forkhead associated (FHA) protein/V8-like Glu-specific endopeptidase